MDSGDGPRFREHCPGCGTSASESRLLFRAVDPVRPSQRHSVFSCGRCDLAWTDAPAAEYAPAYFSIGRAKRMTPGLFKARLRALEGRKPGKLLDAGAGEGDFLHVARQAGWDARSYDPFAPADFRSWSEIRSAGFRPDMITFWQSLEHIDNPVEVLSDARSILAEGGSIFVSLPNFASAQSRWGRNHWFHLDLPRHRVHFTPDTLAAAAGRAGFATSIGAAIAWEYEISGWVGTIANRWTRRPNALYNTMKGYAPEAGGLDRIAAVATALAAPALVPLAVLLTLAAGRKRLGVIEAVLKEG